MDFERLGQNRVDGHARVERTERILENHLQVLAQRAEFGLTQRQNIATIVKDAAGRRRSEFQDGATDRRFATAAFADQTNGFARFNIEAHIVHRFDLARFVTEDASEHGKPSAQILDRDERHRGNLPPRCLHGKSGVGVQPRSSSSASAKSSGVAALSSAAMLFSSPQARASAPTARR